LSLSSASVSADAHRLAFREVWLARFGSISEAASLAEQHLAQAAGDERLILRMQLVLLRLGSLNPGASQPYRELAARMLALGDRPAA